MTARAALAKTDAGLSLAVFAFKLALSLAVVALAGFRQVSDDDYARTVIAQTFAHAPKLDPSGTSWLPFPFWLTGAAMTLFGRSLEVARGVAFFASAAAAAAFFAALRWAGLGRAFALGAALLACASTWNVWLGAATVPEGFVGALVAAGALSLVPPDEAPLARAPLWGAVALFVAGLSRYEAWAVGATFAAIVLWRARRAKDAGAIAVALIPLLAPAAWMAWNLVAHGDALHFFARVSTYRGSLGTPPAPLAEKLSLYPASLLRAFPEVAPLSVAAVVALVWQRKLAPVALAMGALALFLVVGELGDGAPTHHPERALVAVAFATFGLAAFGVERLARERSATTARVAAASALVAVVVMATRVTKTAREYPGQGEADRTAQIAHGRSLREARSFAVSPCAYEHFALIAAYGAPERVTIDAVPAPALRRAVTETCPTVEQRR